MSTIYLASRIPGDMAAGADDRLGRLYVHAAFIICLCLQRFGVMLGGSALFACLPLFGMLLGCMVLTGHAQIRPRATILYLLFVASALVSTLGALAVPDMRFGISTASLALVAITYGLAIFGPSARFDRTVTFDLFLVYARIIAALGIVQWFIQFVGIRIFSFILTVPALRPVLVEHQFNYDPVLHYGSTIRRSNGFLLLEPSIFSQMLVFAIVVDYFVRGNMRWLPLYLAAYVLSFSGTGALALALALPIYACLSIRNFSRMAGFAAVGAVVMAIAALALPDQFASFTSRTNEIEYSGSSGYARFIGPFLPVQDMLHEPRSLIGYGPGATERYDYHVEGTGNSIAKLLLDYGVIGLIAFVVMLVGTLWRRDIAILSLLAVTTFVIGGGYLVFTPILVMMFLLCIWSDREGADAAAPRRRG